MSMRMDHRQLADEMEIYVLNEEIGAGLPIWLPNGVAIRDELEAFVKELERRAGYLRVYSPHIGKESIYEKSGHLKSFAENMYPPMEFKDGQQRYYLRPMNCPHHHKVFEELRPSYRQLPLRIAEYGQVYRYEPSGSLKGLSRVRGLCQNDAHIYVAPESAFGEIRSVLRLHLKCYEALGLSGYRFRLSKRGSEVEGDPELWHRCEDLLREALIAESLPYFEAPGEAAFYGPKIDIQMEFGSGHEESVSSIQLDFMSAERFGLSFVASSGEANRPWIIHRAPLGSHERFVALLLESYQGQMPGWLAPVQVALIPVSELERGHCEQLAYELLEAGFRVKVAAEAGSLAKRIAFAHRTRPFSKMVVGAREIAASRYDLQLRDIRVQGSMCELKARMKGLCKRPQ